MADSAAVLLARIREQMELDGETGSIAKGKSADLIVAEIKGSPGRYGFSIRKVFVAGVEAVS